MAYTTVNDASANFQLKKYTGNGSNGHQITFDGNSNLQPDLAIAKDLGGGNWWVWYDSTRGATKMISSNSNNAEATDANVTAFNTDGVTLGTAPDSNGNGGTYNLYGWKANAGTTSTNTDGATNGYNTTVQANQTAGFSIVKFNAAFDQGNGRYNLGHGLGAKPKFIITKCTGSSADWYTYHEEIDSNDYLRLNNTAGTSNTSSRYTFYKPDISTTIFNMDYNNILLQNQNFICYCWAEVKGYSAFAGYEGNGDADGPFVYTGFKPKVVIVKNLSGTGIWRVYDNSQQSGFNSIDRYKSLENNGAEGDTGHPFDFLANGFKVRGTNSDVNSDGDRFAFAAWADRPFVSSAGVPSPAH
tara:strand:+ start:1950 stop:3020 length:1071 start_codon:yes stop_codon:yes gene_type:complete